MKKTKKPLIITTISAAVLVVVLTGVFLYPCIVPRKISNIVEDGLSDVVKIEFTAPTGFNIKAETTDPDKIEYLIDSISDIEMKKNINQKYSMGSSVAMHCIKENGEKTSIDVAVSESWINGTKYECLPDYYARINLLREEIIEEYIVDQIPSEYRDEIPSEEEVQNAIDEFYN